MTQGEKLHFPRYHLNSLPGTQSCNGLTRTSLLLFQEIRSGATICIHSCVLPPTGHSLGMSLAAKPPHQGIYLHKLAYFFLSVN